MIDEFLDFLRNHPELIDEALRLLRECKTRSGAAISPSSSAASAQR